MSQPSTQKTFGKSTREVPHHSQKAQKWYPATDEPKPKKVSYNEHDSDAIHIMAIWGPELETLSCCDNFTARIGETWEDVAGWPAGIAEVPISDWI